MDYQMARRLDSRRDTGTCACVAHLQGRWARFTRWLRTEENMMGLYLLALLVGGYLAAVRLGF
jgi:hypothetical protein